MKKIILLLVLTLLLTFTGFAQNGSIVYNVCRTENDINMGNLGEDTYNVVNVSADSFTFTAGNQSFAAKKVPDTNFYFTNNNNQETDFYIYLVDKKSFFVIPSATIIANIYKSPYNTWRYYHLDRTLAAEKDNNKRCALETLDKAKASIISYVSKNTEANNNTYAARSKIVYTDFVKNYQSQRNDPAFTKEILAWWQRVVPNAAASFPVLRITILSPSWAFSRNQYGIVTDKMSSAMYIWKSKSDNKCWAEWQSFKYEALGGGAFDTDLKNYRTYHYPMQIDYLQAPEDRRMESGTTYEVDCAPFPTSSLR